MPNKKICPKTICTCLFWYISQTSYADLSPHPCCSALAFQSQQILFSYYTWSSAVSCSSSWAINTKQLPWSSPKRVWSAYKKLTYLACFLHSRAPVGLWCSSHRYTLPHLPTGTQSGFLHMPPPWHFCHEWIHTLVAQEWWPGGCYLSQVVQKTSIPSIAFSLFSASHVSFLGKRNRGRSASEASTHQVILQR